MSNEREKLHAPTMGLPSNYEVMNDICKVQINLKCKKFLKNLLQEGAVW